MIARPAKTAAPPVVVAAAPFRQDFEQGRHRGFFNPSNILHAGGYWYMMTNTTGGAGQAQGLCLFRTPFDAVMTATALHWLPPQAVGRLYRDLAGIIRPGGVFVNADHVPLRRTPALAARSGTVAERERARLTGTRQDWSEWWEAVGTDPVLGPMVEERNRRFSNRGEEFSPVESWHFKALRDAGFSESAVVWRRGRDAIVAATR